MNVYKVSFVAAAALIGGSSQVVAQDKSPISVSVDSNGALPSPVSPFDPKKIQNVAKDSTVLEKESKAFVELVLETIHDNLDTAYTFPNNDLDGLKKDVGQICDGLKFMKVNKEALLKNIQTFLNEAEVEKVIIAKVPLSPEFFELKYYQIGMKKTAQTGIDIISCDAQQGGKVIATFQNVPVSI